MAFYPIDRLRKGNVDFLYTFSSNNINVLIKIIRNHSNRLEIINGFIQKLENIRPDFCFNIIYDIPEYNYLAYKMLIKYYGIKNIDKEMLSNILNNSKYKDYLIKNHLDELLKLSDECIILLISYLFRNRNILKKEFFIVSRSKDMHVRFLFMKYILEEYPSLINIIYKDICMYFINCTYEENEQLSIIPEQMDAEEICEIAILFLKNNDYNTFNRIKEYILNNYKSNYLAYMLDKNGISNYLEKSKEELTKEEEFGKLKKQVLLSDLDRLFVSSSTYKIHLYQDYRSKLSKKVLDDFERRIKYFKSDKALSSTSVSKNIKDEIIRSFFRKSEGLGIKLSNVYEQGLGDLLESYVDKYLALSTRNDYEFVGEGTTCASYRIGDFVFKLVKMKWSYEDEICPNLFLILNNLEEIYLRDKYNVVTAGIEVQKYLKRSARGIDSNYYSLFLSELDKLGYFYLDRLIDGSYGENVRLLDSYKDAFTTDYENLPDWFKECPLVLIDRDLVFKNKDKDNIRVLRSHFS